MNVVKLLTEQFYWNLDAAVGSITLSLSEAPFPSKPPGKVVDVAFHAFESSVTSIVLNAKTCTINFDYGEAGLFNGSNSLLVTYDPS